MATTATNAILESLPPEQKQRFLEIAEPVVLPTRKSLYKPDQPPRYVHFLTSGIGSVVTSMANGDSVEVGLNGREGVPESLHLLGSELGTSECFVQVQATALRMDFKRFAEEFFPLDAFRRPVLRNVQYQILMVGQIAACNRLHDVEERLARWLLMVADRYESARFPLTQEFLAEMIGSRRSTVTLTAGLLRRAGLIDYQRGEIDIIDRKTLEESACECYPITRRLLENYNADLGRYAERSVHSVSI